MNNQKKSWLMKKSIQLTSALKFAKVFMSKMNHCSIFDQISLLCIYVNGKSFPIEWSSNKFCGAFSVEMKIKFQLLCTNISASRADTHTHTHLYIMILHKLYVYIRSTTISSRAHEELNERRNCLRVLVVVEKLSSMLSYTRLWKEYVLHKKCLIISTNDL